MIYIQRVYDFLKFLEQGCAMSPGPVQVLGPSPRSKVPGPRSQVLGPSSQVPGLRSQGSVTRSQVLCPG